MTSFIQQIRDLWNHHRSAVISLAALGFLVMAGSILLNQSRKSVTADEVYLEQDQQTEEAAESTVHAEKDTIIDRIRDRIPLAKKTNERIFKEALLGNGTAVCTVGLREGSATVYVSDMNLRFSNSIGASSYEVLIQNGEIVVWNTDENSGYRFSDPVGVYDEAYVRNRLELISDREMQNTLETAGFTLRSCTMQVVDAGVFVPPEKLEYRSVSQAVLDRIKSAVQERL